MITGYGLPNNDGWADVYCECPVCGHKFTVPEGVPANPGNLQRSMMAMIHRALCEECVMASRKSEMAAKIEADRKRAEFWAREKANADELKIK